MVAQSGVLKQRQKVITHSLPWVILYTRSHLHPTTALLDITVTPSLQDADSAGTNSWKGRRMGPGTPDPNPTAHQPAQTVTSEGTLSLSEHD